MNSSLSWLSTVLDRIASHKIGRRVLLISSYILVSYCSLTFLLLLIDYGAASSIPLLSLQWMSGFFSVVLILAGLGLTFFTTLCSEKEMDDFLEMFQ